MGKYYSSGSGLKLYEIDLADQSCENIYDDSQFGTTSIPNDFLYDSKRNRYLYLSRQGGSIELGAIDNEDGNFDYNFVKSIGLPTGSHFDNGGRLSSAYLRKEDKLVFSWIIEQGDDYYNTLFTYDFNEDSWSQGELIYISSENLSVPEYSDIVCKIYIVYNSLLVIK